MFPKSACFYSTTQDLHSLYMPEIMNNSHPVNLELARSFECLMVRNKLAQVVLELDSKCGNCNQDEESSVHLFFQCPVAVQVWQSKGVYATDISSLNSSLFDCWMKVYHNCRTKEDRCSFFITLWCIWRSRNNAVFRNEPVSAHSIQAMADSIISTSISLRNDPVTEAALQWQKPPPNTFKVNVDAAFSRNKSAVGLIVRNDRGEAIYIATYSGTCSNAFNAEFQGIYRAMVLIEKIKVFNITIETDCLRMVKFLYEVNCDPPWQLLFEAEFCRNFMRRHPDITISHIRREANNVAHMLAKHCWNDDKELEQEYDKGICSEDTEDLIIAESLL